MCGRDGVAPLGLFRLLGFGGFPKHEVERIFLARGYRDALARMQFVERLARELAVAGKTPNRKVDVAALAAIGEPLVFQRVDQ
jgi:hypothetical protein